MPVIREGESDFLKVEQDDVAKMTSAANNALFELLGDDAETITKNKRIVRWDNKRKRYVRGTVGELKDNKHVRNESGQLIRSKSQGKRGELYKKWRESHKLNEQEIGEETREKPSLRGRRFEKKEKAKNSAKHILKHCEEEWVSFMDRASQWSEDATADRERLEGEGEEQDQADE